MGRFSFVLVPVAALGLLAVGAVAACVGDDPTNKVSSESEAGSPSGGVDGGPMGTGDEGGSSGSDGGNPSGDGAVDAAPPPCGYPGEACCAAPVKPCNDGAACSTGATKVCRVTSAWAVGTFGVTIGGNPFPVARTASMQYDGSTWTIGPNVPTDWVPNAISQGGAASVRVVSFHNNDLGGKVFGLAGPAWHECTANKACVAPLTSGGKLVDFYAVTNVDGEYWLGGVNKIYRCASGDTKCSESTTGLSGQSWAFGNFAGTSASDLWYSAIDRAFHYDGATWTVHPNLKAYSIYQVRKSDTWVGTSTFQHWNGTAWSAEMNVGANPAPGSVYSIGGATTDDLLAVGVDNARAAFSAHWDGKGWSLVSLPAGATGVQSLWAPSVSEAFAVGDNAGVYKWDGKAWSAMPSPAPVADSGETLVAGSLRWVAVNGFARPRP